MFNAQRNLFIAVLAIVGTALAGCAQPYQPSSGAGTAYPNAQRQSSQNPGYVDRKANRQVNRQEHRVNNRLDRETDRAVDRGINKMLGDIFD